jgi:hypothetical protein
MKIPASAAGRLAEFVKSNRKDTNSDVLVNSGFKTIKQGANKGEMVALYRPSNSENIFANLKNAFLGRRPAEREEVFMLLKNKGMSEKKANEVLAKITQGKGGVGYSASELKAEISVFESRQTKGKVTIHDQNISVDDAIKNRS